MGKWLMVINLGKYDKYYLVRKDMLTEVKDVANKLIDEFEKNIPPMSIESYVENGLETIYSKDIVEPVKIGVKIMRVVEI